MKNRSGLTRWSFAVLSLCFMVAGIRSAQGETPSAYQALPVIGSTSEPPLVMLVMGRDHKLYYEAYNDASDLDGDGDLDLHYNPDIDYYGYFDSYKVYTYSSTNERFEPDRVTADKKVDPSASDEWSGDYLNYLTMSRMDCLRKVLYGGYRSTDTATETVLERAYIPPDAHSWGKEYYDETRDGYDIADYTPLSAPASGTYHLFAITSQCGSDDGCAPLLRVLEDRSERIWDWVTIAFQSGIGGTTLGTPTDYEVRVLVGDPGMAEDNCKLYVDSSTGSTVYKPIGLLQRYGENQQMYFGLITGSYAKNFSGGVLRRNISDIQDEIDPNTGQILTSVNGVIQNINRLRLMGLQYSAVSASILFQDTSSMYASLSPYLYTSTLIAQPPPSGGGGGGGGGGYDGCSWNNTPRSEGECPMWGNPIGEMMYETLRYFSGAASPTTEFTYSSSDDCYDNDLGLGLPSWEDPYATYPYCAKPYMLVISDISPSYDSNQLPGSYFGSFTGDISGLDVETLGDDIGSAELAAADRFIGVAGTNDDGVCSQKTVDGFGDINGLCPEEPSKGGSYYSASVAYYGNMNDMSTVSGTQSVGTFAVGLASPLPEIEITVGESLITLVPFGKSVYATSPVVISSAEGDFQPSNAIVDFYVDSIGETSGTFRINFEDMEEGADYDMDTLVIYEYQVVDADGNAVTDPADGVYVDITVTAEEAAASISQHNGYVISGTTADGAYLVVRDVNTAETSDVDYYLDTPESGNWADGAALPLTSTRRFEPVSSAGSSPATLLENPLWFAGKWGGFEDQNDNDIPDLDTEWDSDGDGTPDNYFYVQNPTRLEEQLNATFSLIAAKSASGTSSSVLATTNEGEGTLLQAFFRPLVNTGDAELTWVGYLQSLWMDSEGNIREDTNGNKQLDIDVDSVLVFVLDNGETKAHVYEVSAGNEYPDTDSDGYMTISLDEITPVWEAGSLLAETPAADRNIYTYPTGGGTDLISFENGSNFDTLKYYLGVSSDDITAFPSANISLLGTSLDDRAATLISYIRGEDVSGLRPRTIDGNVWKLGDVVYSTPVSISGAVESYHSIYSDSSYGDYVAAQNGRQTMVYAGANDGMLHAFTAGVYNEATHGLVASTDTMTNGQGDTVGDEMWAYIPKAVLPHLKWLADPDYDHTYYVDLMPKVFDAKIAGVSGDQWGTFLLLGLNMGGKDIEVDYDGDGAMETFAPTYTLLDITDPTDPKFMWERSYDGLGMSRSVPTIIKIGGDYWDENDAWVDGTDDQWLAVFGSGPHGNYAYEGISDQPGRIYVIDLKTGAPYDPNGAIATDYLFTTSDYSAINSPVNLDKGLTYEVNAMYFGESLVSGGDIIGKAWSIDTYDRDDADFTNKTDPRYWSVDDDPEDWELHLLMETLPSGDTIGPVTAPMNLSTDGYGNIWVYFGTGKFVSESDKATTDQQYLFGLKDPLFHDAKDYTTWSYPTDSTEQTLDFDSEGGLLEANNYRVYTDKSVEVYEGGSWNALGSFDDLLSLVRYDGNTDTEWLDGWVRELEVDPAGSEPSERCISGFSLLGGAAIVTGYSPSEAQCELGGSSRLYGLYYETGTAYYKPLLGDSGNDTDPVDESTDIGGGAPPSNTGLTPTGEQALTQLSTGQIVQSDVYTPFRYRSRITNWFD